MYLFRESFPSFFFGEGNLSVVPIWLAPLFFYFFARLVSSPPGRDRGGERGITLPPTLLSLWILNHF